MRVQLKVGGKFLLKLNISKRPIANKYCEGKMKSTSKGELKGLEIAEREGNGSDGTPERQLKGDVSISSPRWRAARGGSLGYDARSVHWSGLRAMFSDADKEGPFHPS